MTSLESSASTGRIGILLPGSFQTDEPLNPKKNRHYRIFEALTELNVDVEPVWYSDEVVEAVRSQLLQLDGVLVWVNPIFDGQNRLVLDAMLEDVASRGVFVSAHPQIIQMIGTKEVLVRTCELGWGADTYVYKTVQEFREEFPPRLASAGPRVLKQNRGHSGDGVWKVEVSDASPPANGAGPSGADAILRVEHAKDGHIEDGVRLSAFMSRCEKYFSDGGCVIDQPFQPRVSEGMVRCYMIHDEVAGFMHKLPEGDGIRVAGLPGTIYEPSAPRFSALRTNVESDWVPAMQRLLDIDTTSLPVIWDADFLYGPKTEAGEDTFVLCEINVSSVFPYPDEATVRIAGAAVTRILAARQSRV